MVKKKGRIPTLLRNQCGKASLTVEAALVMPLFLYFMIAFLYFIQIFSLQEQIQSEITKMGLNLSKTAYVYQEFPGIEEAQNFDQTIFGTDFEIGLQELTRTIAEGGLLKGCAVKYLDKDWINKSCIQNGFDGISFYSSSVLNDEDCIDIIVRYRVKIPIKLFSLEDMRMIQRVRLRSWTGYEVAASYSMEEESDKENELIVYITETGSVYHRSKDCTHIKLSVTSVLGIPSELRNDNGAKYYSCEACCSGEESNFSTYYITSDGTRYHSRNNCSKIKRTVKEIKFSEIGSRLPCKRCGN